MIGHLQKLTSDILTLSNNLFQLTTGYASFAGYADSVADGTDLHVLLSGSGAGFAGFFDKLANKIADFF